MQLWLSILAETAGAFTRPSFALFQEFLTGWVLCPGRHTVTAIIRAIGDASRAHDAYHRFLQRGAWCLPTLWTVLARQIVRWFCPSGRILLIVDDTLARKSGHHVHGAGYFRDPLASTQRKIAYALGLNVVTLAVSVTPFWRRQPLALTVATQLYWKGGPSRIQIAARMVQALAWALPEDRCFDLVADGAYAALAGCTLPRTALFSRMRRDAALFAPAPPRRPGQRGRPRLRGERLPAPAQIAASATDWQPCTFPARGQLRSRLMLRRTVLWYEVCGSRPVELIIVRDPDGKEPDDYFFTTRADASRRVVATIYAKRWPIEETYREVKQLVRAHQPQTWKGVGPFRAVSLGFWLHTAVWAWYIRLHDTPPTWTATPWHCTKRHATFADALAALRSTLLHHRISCHLPQTSQLAKILEPLIDLLAHAA